MLFAEALPFALYIGISEELFWTMNPHRMKPYISAHKMRLQEVDQNAWLYGMYTRLALMSTVGNMFRGKGQEPFDYPNEPQMTKAEKEKAVAETPQTDEEIIKQTELVFASLGVMMANFEASKNN